MASTFTAARNLEKPGRGDYVGTWDTPVNNNMDVIDGGAGGSVSITVGAANITLSAAQFQQNLLTFVSTLTANISVTFPTSFKGPYTIYNACTGSSAFTITLLTTAAGGQQIGAPPFQPVDVFSNGTDLFYRNLAPIGTILPYAGTATPAWVNACSIRPYLKCNGASFSSATYPGLANLLGGTTLPDLSGRYHAYFNDGTGRITTNIGLDGNTNLATCGEQQTTLTEANLPPHRHGLAMRSDVDGNVTWTGANFIARRTDIGNTFARDTATDTNTAMILQSTGISDPFYNRAPPSQVVGIPLIRAG